MSQSHKTSFLIVLIMVFLAPLFFIPGVLYMGSAKSALLSLGTVVTLLVFLYECWRNGSIALSKTHLLTVVGLLPIIYLLSALLATPSSLSLLGYNFEIGTFGFMLLGSVTLVLVSLIFSETSHFLQALMALFASFSVLAVFAIVKIISGGTWLVFGTFGGNMGNPIGSWTDLSIVFGLLSLLSVTVLGMLPMKGSVRAWLYVVFALSTFLLVVLGYSVAFALTLVGSILLYFYFSKVETQFHFSKDDERGAGTKSFFSRKTLLPAILTGVLLILIINPTISDTRGKLTNFISGSFGIQNSDVRPTLSTTLSISKAVLSQVALLGSGPNTFSQDWLIFKPANVNSTPFWAVTFPFGAGFIPTQIATTGILGSALWLAFFVLLLVLSVRTLSKIPESRGDRFALISGLLVTLFLWTASILYIPSAVVLWLSFVFVGFLLAVSRVNNVVTLKSINLKENRQSRFVSALLIVMVSVGALYIGWVGGEKTVASYHFKKASDLANVSGVSIDDVEKHLEKAVQLAPVDTHFIALSRLNFAKAQAAASSATGTPEQNQAMFQESLGRSIQAARAAVNANPAGYENWVSLGLIYSVLVPDPLKVEGAYENAQFAFSEAYKRNPSNPELPLLLAQLEINKGNIDSARSYIRNSIALKEDYADAYLALAKLEINQKNIPAAISSTEALTILAPNNAGVRFELGVLRYSNSDFEGASEAFSEALRISPDYANAKYYLGLTFSKLDRAGEARDLFEELLSSNPDNADLKSAIESLNKIKK